MGGVGKKSEHTCDGMSHTSHSKTEFLHLRLNEWQSACTCVCKMKRSGGKHTTTANGAGGDAKRKKRKKRGRRMTLLELIKDPSVNEDTKLVAVSNIDDRMAYVTKMFNMLSRYAEAKNIQCEKPHERTWAYYTQNLYLQILDVNRARHNSKPDDRVCASATPPLLCPVQAGAPQRSTCHE